MAKVKVVGVKLILELSFWERVGALHASPQVSLSAVTEIEFVEKLWSNKVLRGLRAPGTGFPYVVLLGTMRGRKYRDFTAIKGRPAGVVISLDEGPFKRWIFTLEQPKSEIEGLIAR
ncbi:hypothetical protein MCEMKE14_01142 [Candidatus Nanopelagicaceae bacterium]